MLEIKKFKYLVNDTPIKFLGHTFYKGNIYQIKGKNGVGKSTFIRQLIKKDALKNRYAAQWQAPQLLDNASIIDNIKFTNAKLSDAQILDKLKIFKLDKIGYEKCLNLSGGERQKVQIVSLLLAQEEVLFFDEPFNNLDKEAIINLEAQLSELKQTKIIFIVNHYANLLETNNTFDFIDNIIVLTNSDEVVDQITVGEYKRQIKPKMFLKELKKFFSISLIKICIIIVSLVTFMTFLSNVNQEIANLKNSIAQDIIYTEIDLNRCEPNCQESANFSLEDIDMIKNIEGVRSVSVGESIYNFDLIQESDTKIITSFSRVGLNFYDIVSSSLEQKAFMGDTVHQATLTNFLQPAEMLERLEGELDKYNLTSLLYGEFPANNQEIIVDEYMAAYLMQENGYTSYKELIGTKIDFPTISCTKFDCGQNQIAYKDSDILNVSYTVTGIFESATPNGTNILRGYDDTQIYQTQYTQFLNRAGISESQFEQNFKDGFNQLFIEVDPAMQTSVIDYLESIDKEFFTISASTFLDSDTMAKLKILQIILLITTIIIAILCGVINIFLKKTLLNNLEKFIIYLRQNTFSEKRIIRFINTILALENAVVIIVILAGCVIMQVDLIIGCIFIVVMQLMQLTFSKTKL